MASHRTTARGFLLLMLIGVFTGTASAAVPLVTALPVVGNVTYIDDFGAPRSQGPHEGNDLMSIRHQPAVAFEGGTVEKHFRTIRSTCMLYLHGFSGMTYVYIHLNNDAGPTNDNKAGCAEGAYAPGLKTGDTVKRGQLVGFVGDSGDADGIQPHLHFEIRRPGGAAIDPYRYLRRSVELLFPRPKPGAGDVSLTLKKARVVKSDASSITVRTKRVVLQPMGLSYLLTRNVTLSTDGAVVERWSSTGARTATTLSTAKVGEPVRVWTTTFPPGWQAQKAGAGFLSASRVVLGLN
jgi:Peptidase family M23